MHPRRSHGLLLAAVAAMVSLVAADESSTTTTTTTTTPVPACTAMSHTNGAFFDLRPDIAIAPEEGKTAKGATADYHARGYDYGRNFTLNICGPVVEPVEDVVGLGVAEWRNVSAYYTYKGEIYSIGQTSLDLKSHGRKLVLQYTDGSPCGQRKSDSDNLDARQVDEAAPPAPEESHAFHAYDAHQAEKAEKDAFLKGSHPTSYSSVSVAGGEDDDDSSYRPRRKSATISFHCDPDVLAGQVGVSFVAADPDDCAYFFEVRSQHACARAEPHQPGSVGPGSVFAIILVITVLVYFGGGVFYQRTVAHARGWRQLPNYTLWAGIWNFISDLLIIALSSCARLLPGRRGGYRHLASSPSRGRDHASENRLIDQLDEEWDD